MNGTEHHSRILVVEDQRAIQDVFGRILTENTAPTGLFNVLKASLFEENCAQPRQDLEFDWEIATRDVDGLEQVRVAQAQERPFALAFVDLAQSTGRQCLDFVERLWQVDPRLQVVFCTGHVDLTWKEISARLSKTDRLLLLKKPFADEEVFQLAVAMTEKWQLTRDLQAQVVSLQEANQRLENEVASRQSAEARLRHMSNFDTLTELPNRQMLREHLDRSIARRQRDVSHVDALLFLDIDNFKVINDSLGHSAGDELLIQVAKRLSQHRRKYDLVSLERPTTACRLGGDEFVLLLEHLKSPCEAAAVADRLTQVLCEPFKLLGKEVIISTSVGIAIIDRRTKDAEEVFRNADTAMYEAKYSGKNRFALFDQNMHSAVVARLDMERSLRRAIQEQEFQLYYQPIVELKSQRTVGFEALLRWMTPDGQIVLPGEFISLAEETGLIVPIGQWVLEEACRQMAIWNQGRGPDEEFTVSVNVSKRQFTEPLFIDEVAQALQKTGLSGSNLHIEVTESLVMENPATIVAKLHQLRELGIKIHMDDFGTGHSSLSCLHQFPIDVLKIDRSFVNTMEGNADYQAIVEAIIVLAHNLRTLVIAEGIESITQLEGLARLRCDFGQGYYFSPPRPADDVGLFSRSWTATPAVVPAAELAACSTLTVALPN